MLRILEDLNTKYLSWVEDFILGGFVNCCPTKFVAVKLVLLVFFVLLLLLPAFRLIVSFRLTVLTFSPHSKLITYGGRLALFQPYGSPVSSYGVLQNY